MATKIRSASKYDASVEHISAFEVAAEVNVYAVSNLADKHAPELKNQRKRRFNSRGTVPYAAPMED